MHSSSSARALYRVFVAPSPRAAACPLLLAHRQLPLPSGFSSTRIRTKYTKGTRRPALSDHYVMDNAIQASRVNIVDDQGIRYHDISLRDALSLFNRTTHSLLQVSPGKLDHDGQIDTPSVPVCRIVSKIDLRAQHERKLDLIRQKAKGQTTGKNLEMNWAIAGGDLKHRLGKLKEFLCEGRKVEVLLGPKRKGKKATTDEANGVLKALRQAAAECEGAREGKSAGTVQGVMTIVFEGKKAKEKGNANQDARDEDDFAKGRGGHSSSQNAATV